MPIRVVKTSSLLPSRASPNAYAILLRFVMDQSCQADCRQLNRPATRRGLRLDPDQLFVDALKCRPHREDAGFEIDVLPLEPEDLALAESDGHGGSKRSFMTLSAHGVEEGTGLFRCKPLDLGSFCSRRIDQRGHVSWYLTILQGHGKCTAECDAANRDCTPGLSLGDAGTMSRSWAGFVR